MRLRHKIPHLGRSINFDTPIDKPFKVLSNDEPENLMHLKSLLERSNI